MKRTFILLVFLSIYLISYGVYLTNVPFELVQPNGEVLKVFITGDEFFRRVHDSEGYSIVPGENGWYYYAVYDETNDELIPSEYIVSFVNTVELPMEKELGISLEKYIEKRRIFYEGTESDISGASLTSFEPSDSRTTTNMANIIICIGFSDTPSMTYNHSQVDAMFSGPQNSVKDYFNVMSYGQLNIDSYYHPSPNGNILRFYQDSNPRSYYVDVPEILQATREHTLLRNAINWVNANYPIPSSINLDVNNDGNCDYITFIVQGAVAGWSDLLWPHKWSLYTYNVSINGKRVYDYNFELDGTSTYFNVGTFCHEGFHVLGAPDLYHYYQQTSLKAVGVWDIMDNTSSSRPQSMSAYMKLRYGKWVYNNSYTHLNFPQATVNQTYEVFPFYSNDGTDPHKPIIHRIPMTGTTTQYSFVEYRKKTGAYYENSLPGEGFLIYRINTAYNGNATFQSNQSGGSVTTAYEEVYLYRPGSSQTSGSGVYTQGNLNQATYPSNGLTSFNSTTNPKPCQSNGNAETTLNINNILYDSATDSYTFFYGNPDNRTISVSANELPLTYHSGSIGSVNVSSNVLWRVTIPAAASWLSASITKGLNNGTVTFSSLSENNTGSIRSAYVTITGNSQTFNITVVQNIDECNPPTNFEVNYVSDCEAELTWDDPTSDNIFNIFRNSVQIASNVTTTSYTDSGFDSFSGHTWSVTTVCESNESGPASVIKDACETVTTYIITASAGSNGAIAPSGEVPVNEGEDQTFIITPNTNYKISSVLVDDEEVFSISPSGWGRGEEFTYTFTNVTANHSIAASFSIKTYSVSISANLSEGGLVEIVGSVNLTESFESGTNVTVKASPSENYEFLNWTDTSTGETIYSFPTYSFTITEDVTLTANFELVSTSDYYTVTVIASTGGTVEIVGSVNLTELIESGTNVTVKATANPNYNFINWTDSDDLEVSDDLEYEFEVSEDVTLTANFELVSTSDYYTVTVIAGIGGTVEIVGYENLIELIESGTNVTVKATANPNYIFINWTDSEDFEVSEDSEYEFEVTEDVVLTANFEPLSTSDYYTVTVIAGTGGSVEIVGFVNLTESFESGASITVKATPSENYEFLNWTDTSTDETIYSFPTYTFTVTEDITLTANFELVSTTDYYTVTVIAGEGGSVEIVGYVNLTELIESGTNVTVKATPNPNYNFINWTDSEDFEVSEDSEYEFEVTEDVTLTANFELVSTSDYYTVTVIAGIGGSVEIVGFVNLTESFESGTNVTVKATANSNYIFINWTDSEDFEVSEDAEYQFVVIEDITLIANFEPISTSDYYSVTVIAGEGGTVEIEDFGSLSELIEAGTSATVKATPNSGYTFLYWTYSGGTEYDNPYTFTVTENITLTASFKQEDKFNVTIIVNPENAGTVEGAGEYDEDEEVIVTATPNEGWNFVNWTIDDEEVSDNTTYSFFITEDVVLTANFESAVTPDYYIVTVVAGTGGTVEIVGSVNLSESFESGTPITVKATPSENYEFVNWINATTGETIYSFPTYSFPVTEDISLKANFDALAAPVGKVIATISGNNVVVEWAEPGTLLPTTYILDDGTAEQSWRGNPNYSSSYGNQFNVGESGVLTSIDIYSRNASDNTNRQVNIEIYNAQRKLVGSSASFVLQGNNTWQNVELDNIPYSGTFYVMVHWTATSGQSHSLGYDNNGTNKNEELNWIKIGEYWELLHNLTSQALPGVFMIRANANSAGKSVSYGSTGDNRALENYMVYRLLEGQAETNWSLIADNVSNPNYTDTDWISLPEGIYQYAVKAKYTGNILSAPKLSNPVEKITVGISESETYQFTIYPNPVKDELIVSGLKFNEGTLSRTLSRTLSEVEMEVEIFDVLGKKTNNFQFSILNFQLIVDVSMLPTGVYIIRLIEDEHIISTQRFVKK